ncbi:MAG: hypothetical protein HKN44_04795 [Ilumatobacter sp.]|nr:hypothetical protein [Ilumatobacter sp.]
MLITVLLVGALASMVAFGVALTVRSKRDFDDANEVVPGVPSGAPASWAGAHSPEARLHRRLRAAVLGIHDNARLREVGLADHASQIEREALAIDARLVAAASSPARHRVAAVAAVEPSVVAVEDAVAALLAGTTVGDSRELLAQSVADADIRLQALAEARAEVERIDAGWDEPGAATS